MADDPPISRMQPSSRRLPRFACADMPARIAALRVDRRGYPVPKFVAWVEGEPDFRCACPEFMATALRRRLCWICGEPLGRWFAFVIGPMCGINRISAEPPSHRDCALFAAHHCPFLANSSAKRPSRPLPAGHKPPPGVMVEHNPGVSLVWVTDSFTMLRVDNGTLLRVGEPSDIMFFCQGRAAVRAEIEAAVDKGLPILIEQAELQGPEAIAALAQMRGEFMARLP